MSTQQICQYIFDNSSPRVNKDGCFVIDEQEWFVQQCALVAFLKYGESEVWDDLLNDSSCLEPQYKDQTLFEACQIALEPYLSDLLVDAMPEYLRGLWADAQVDQQIRDVKQDSIETSPPEVNY